MYLLLEHIQRGISPVGKPALRIVQLIRGDAKIQQNPVDPAFCDPILKKCLHGISHIFVIIVHKSDPVPKRGESLSCRSKCVVVLVDADQMSSLCEPRSNLEGVAAAAKGSVYIDSVRPDAESFQDLLQKHRSMFEFQFLHLLPHAGAAAKGSARLFRALPVRAKHTLSAKTGLSLMPHRCTAAYGTISLIK